MFTRSTQYREVMDEFLSHGSCVEANNYFDSLMDPNPDITFGEVMDSFLASEETLESWAIFGFLAARDKCDPGLRENLLSKIVDPMKALRLYQKIEDLTDREDKVLEKVFKNRLKKAEKELESEGRAKERVSG